MELSKRRSLIDSSGIRKVFSLAATMKDPINLSIGQPDYDVPQALKDSCINAIQAGKNSYTLTAGIPALREKVLKRYQDQGVNVEDSMIASGTSGSLMLLLLVLLDPGDEVLVPDPYFVMYKHLTNLVGAKPIFVDTNPTFRLTREALEAACTPKTKMLILNTPSNPTGIVYTKEECQMIAEFAEEKDLWVLCDEIYEPFVYDEEFVSPSQFLKKPIIVSGLSKSVAMTGWRLGWAVGPKDVILGISELQQYTFVCAPSMVQYAALDAMDFDTSGFCEEYKARRDIIYKGLVDAGYQVRKPGGAFYIYPEAPGGDGDVFVNKAIEKQLLIVPGSVFSEHKTHFRISFAASREKLALGVKVLGELYKEFQ